jgi:hypothetical protein
LATQRQIEATDRRIDQLVYELYGLTDEEIAIGDSQASRTSALHVNRHTTTASRISALARRIQRAEVCGE